MTFSSCLNEQVLILDGATGTMIQDLSLGDEYFGGSDYKMLSDLLCFSQPEAMKGIHTAFLQAGANAIETNTFGASPMRLSEYDFSGLDLASFDPLPYGIDPRTLDYQQLSRHLSRRGAEIACEARDAYRAGSGYDDRPLFVLGSIGPSNRVLSHSRAELTESTFDAVQDNFYHQCCGLLEGGVDVFLYETQQDVLELKAAIMGGFQAMHDLGRRVPVMAQVTVDQFSRMQIFNTDAHAALVSIQGLGIDVFGINCSIGPDLMGKTVEKLCRHAQVPVSVVPNAGLPVSENGKTVFKFAPDKFAEHHRAFVEEYGVNIVGGCCGTRPDHIRATVEALKTATPKSRTPEPGLYVSGMEEAVRLDGAKTLIRFGERLNVRGSKKVREAVENNTGIDHDALEEVAHEQVDGLGCEVIDICMDSNQISTVETLKEVVHIQSAGLSSAVSIDSFQVDALEEAIKVYAGRPIINSVSMEEASPGVLKIDAVMEATKAFDPVYVGLCTGPTGPGATAEEKYDLASQIIDAAWSRHHVTADRLFIDVNVFPIGSESDETMNFALETLEGIRRVKEAYPDTQTILGVGNLTNGLAKKPYMRKVLTSVFLDEARKVGLDAAIINPNHYVFVEDLEPEHYELGLRTIQQRDMDAYSELEVIAEAKRGIVVERRSSYDDLPLETAICEKIKDGFKEREKGSFDYRGQTYEYQDKIAVQVAEAMDAHAPLDFVNQYLMAAMQDLGDGFGRGEVSLPHLLKSADIMRQAMAFLEAFMQHESGIEASDTVQYKGTVVIGTVYQDVHSIGKDLARTLLENYGYNVIDLGTMAPLQSFIDAAKEHNADAIGLSALLVQTSNHMITLSKMMEEQGLDLPILIGGAPVSTRHAAYVAMKGQDDYDAMRSDVFYCRTAMDGVNVMNRLMADEDTSTYLKANRKKLIARHQRAEKRAEEEEHHLATLPRRVVEFNGIHWTESLPFTEREIRFSLRDFAPHIDKEMLYSLNWRFGGKGAQKRAGHSPDSLDQLFDHWIEKAAHCLHPSGVLRLFPCQSDEDSLVLFDPEDPACEVARIDFTPVIGANEDDIVSGAQYYPPVESGVLGIAALQLTTGGAQVDVVLEQMEAEEDSEGHLMLQGLSDRIAEDLAGHLHDEWRQALGVNPGEGTRWSPGYPGMRAMAMNRVILELLDAQRLLGVQLTEADQFSPTGTTAAVISFHPDARYT